MSENFNPADYMRVLVRRRKTKDSRGNEQWIEESHLYLDVKYRVLWFRQIYPEGFIDTIEIEVNNSFARIEAIAYDKDPATGGKRLGRGRRQVMASDFKDYVEKAETQAVGRALAMAGFGTQFCDDLNEEDDLADSPIQSSFKYKHIANGSKTGNASASQQSKRQTKVADKDKHEPVNVYRLVKADKNNRTDGKVIVRVALQDKSNKVITAWATDNEANIADLPTGTTLEVNLAQKDSSLIVNSYKVLDKKKSSVA